MGAVDTLKYQYSLTLPLKHSSDSNELFLSDDSDISDVDIRHCFTDGFSNPYIGSRHLIVFTTVLKKIKGNHNE